MTTRTYAERIAAWRQGNPGKRLTFDLLLEICDATRLWDADLTDATLRGANLWDANLWGADLRGADLRGASLGYAKLWGANLTDADLRAANLRLANLRLADLTGANLRGADLRGADLRGAKLWGANLRGANLRGANLSGVNLRGADLAGADWEGLQITGLPSGQIVLTPTPDGWELRVGCWQGTPEELAELIAKDDGWPEAEGYEITRRRPGLQAALALIDAHIALHPNVINELKTRWSAK